MSEIEGMEFEYLRLKDLLPGIYNVFVSTSNIYCSGLAGVAIPIQDGNVISAPPASIKHSGL